ncbi:hypothetical protein IT568_03090 [bacterium]|nr:hypothetical protein [bacterium]
MLKTKVLITVTTYPLPSRRYDELVCTAGILEDGSWVRIYPVPFKFLEFEKYQWVKLELKKRIDDFRPESHSPAKTKLEDLEIVGKIDTKNFWEERKKYCLKNVYVSLEKLIEDSKAPLNKSLATFKPTKIIDFMVEEAEREWKSSWIEQLKQIDLFTQGSKRIPIRKLPYKFSYKFLDESGKESKLMIEDWEIGALYWNCLKKADNEKIALEKVREKYFDSFVLEKELYFFLGTTLEFHRRRVSNPFVIIGVFYPMKNINENQELLF